MKNTILLVLATLSLGACYKPDSGTDNPNNGNCDFQSTILAPEGYSLQYIGAADNTVFKMDGFQFINDTLGYAMSPTNSGGFVSLFKTVDGGKTWADMYVNIPFVASSMAFSDESYGLISVMDISGQEKCMALKTENGCETWTIVEYPNLTGFLNHLQFDEEGRLFAMLYKGSTPNVVRSDDGGASFYSINQDQNLGFGSNTFSFLLFQDKIYASGYAGKILVMDKTGNLLKTVQAPQSSIYDLQVIDDNNLVAAFSNATLKTKNGGNSWETIFPGSARLIDFSTPENGLILRTKSYCNSDVYHANDLFAATNDGGATWKEPDETSTNIAVFYSNSQKIAAGTYLMFIGGNLWKLQKN